MLNLQPMLDVPIYGRIATLELFRPHVSIYIYIQLLSCSLIMVLLVSYSLQGETQDFLFIVTERHKFCVLQWDAESSELVTR